MRQKTAFWCQRNSNGRLKTIPPFGTGPRPRPLLRRCRFAFSSPSTRPGDSPWFRGAILPLPVSSATMMEMELAIRIHIEQLPEGVYLATSDELSGLVAQGRTVAETLEIARDVARKLIEARREHQTQLSLPPASAQSDYTIVVASGCLHHRSPSGGLCPYRSRGRQATRTLSTAFPNSRSRTPPRPSVHYVEAGFGRIVGDGNFRIRRYSIRTHRP
jgi:predicted RNase H-like HicB family nuclease